MIPFQPVNATPSRPVLSDDGPPDAVWLKTLKFRSYPYDLWTIGDGPEVCVQICPDGVRVYLEAKEDSLSTGETVDLRFNMSRRDILDLIRILFPHREFAVREQSSDFKAGVAAERERAVELIRGGKFPREKVWEWCDEMDAYREGLLVAILGTS